MSSARRLPVGAEVVAAGVSFRVWAPARKSVEVVIDGGASHPLTPDGAGYFAGTAAGLAAGARYRYRLDGDGPFPDPASRFQPEGPHGPSEVIDPARFRWTDSAWKGAALAGQVLYEMHVGTFTREGTWAAAAKELPELAACGITVLEVMPVADFPGRFGWGYDGVNLFAPTRLYGPPDDFRRFVDAAHAAGLGVILDVVYNHLGPDGNYLSAVRQGLLHGASYKTDWGEAINFDGADAGPVREFFVANAGYWIDEFHLDGLRLDATQHIFDDSPDHVLAAIGRRVREAAPGPGHDHRRRERAAAHQARPARRQGRLRPGRAVERRLPPHRHGRPDRAQRGLLHRLPRRPAGVHLGGEVRLPVPGPALLVAGEAPRRRRRSTCRRPRSSPSSRTTTRWPTRPAACGLHQLTSPGRSGP